MWMRRCCEETINSFTFLQFLANRQPTIPIRNAAIIHNAERSDEEQRNSYLDDEEVEREERESSHRPAIELFIPLPYRQKRLTLFPTVNSLILLIFLCFLFLLFLNRLTTPIS
jgi:hypothetical protein